MLYNIVILPIETIVDWVFKFSTNKMPQIGVMGAICCVSIVINFLALPLYNIADSLQEKERNIQQSLSKWVKHIKKNFKGDERFMMLQTYYRENGYHPLYALRSSLSILIEIPFFIAAYHYLSNCQVLNSAEFWIFKNLGQPDRLFSIEIGNFSFIVNILPILMTGINIVSGWIYTKGATKKEKIQLYIMALLFLVLLYKSPSGLVLYWILNNIFSLVKNVVAKSKYSKQFVHLFISFLFATATVIILKGNSHTKSKIAFVLFTILVVIIPIAVRLLRDSLSKFLKTINVQQLQSLPLLLSSGIGLAIFAGILLPSSIISTSPIEFSFLGNTESPVSYIWTCFFSFSGFFVFWPFCIYKLFGEKTRTVLPTFLFVLFISAIFNVFVFNFSYGNLNTAFILDDASVLKNYSVFYAFLPFLASLCLIIIIACFAKAKKLQTVIFACTTLCVAEGGYGVFKYRFIYSEFEKYKDGIAKNEENNLFSEINPVYHLCKTGKNVVIIFLDRAINGFVPDIFEKFPDIRKQFGEFTYYKNTLSFSDFTVTGIPPMVGGYEYSQVNMNLRSDELLRDKHNEALLVMPVLFSDANFDVTVTDPSWPNYTERGDLDFFKQKDIAVKEIQGKYLNKYLIEKRLSDIGRADLVCHEQIKNFVVLESIFPVFRKTFYNNCMNLQSGSLSPNVLCFFSQLSNLYYLRELTDFSSQKDTFVYMENQTTHEIYNPLSINDDFETASDGHIDNSTLHWQANVAALKQIGKYIDYLKENDCFDNTRIIIVSDHGRDIDVPCFNSFQAPHIPAFFSALLMMKDFNQKNFVVDDSFMMNADTLFLAKKDLPIANKNPFTGKILEQRKENGVNVYHCTDWNAYHFQDEKQFVLDKKQAWHVQDNLYEPKNWIPLTEWEKMNGGAEQ